jgi:hypothetical protein
VADILFSSPSKHSTYELAHRCGVFVRPEFEHPIDLTDLTRLTAASEAPFVRRSSRACHSLYAVSAAALPSVS